VSNLPIQNANELSHEHTGGRLADQQAVAAVRLVLIERVARDAKIKREMVYLWLDEALYQLRERGSFSRAESIGAALLLDELYAELGASSEQRVMLDAALTHG
jgi:hypothetical protein